MDLVAGVRKEGSRGGRADFKWEDVKNDQHRENYLGHSLMAPVGRWQKNRDLAWYAKGDNSEAAQSAANARAEEIRRIKEAEQDALSEALGYPVMPKPKPLEKVEASDVERAIKETGDDEEGDDARGVGFSGVTGLAATKPKAESEMMPAQLGSRGGLDGPARDAVFKPPRRRSRSRDRERDADRKGRRSRSRSRDRDRHHRHQARATETDTTGRDLGHATLTGEGIVSASKDRRETAVIRLFQDDGKGHGRDSETEITTNGVERLDQGNVRRSLIWA